MNSKRVAATALLLAALPACAAPPGSGEHVGEATEALSNVCPSTSVNGIDIASFQHPGGAGINWGQVATAEKFVIVKATESNDYVNGYYAGDVAGARGAGLIAGSYHFLAPSSQTGVSGTAQAQYFLAHASIQPGDLPPMLDVETSSLYNSVLPSVGDVTSWLSTVQSATGMKPIIYIGYYVIGDLGTPSALGDYFINVPNYSSCPSYPDSYPIANLVMWQKTSTASIPGISGHVDADEFYGDMNALLNFAHADQAATGYLDHAGCDTVNGWGWDPDNKTASTNVDVYYNGPAGGAGADGHPQSGEPLAPGPLHGARLVQPRVLDADAALALRRRGARCPRLRDRFERHRERRAQGVAAVDHLRADHAPAEHGQAVDHRPRRLRRLEVRRVRGHRARRRSRRSTPSPTDRRSRPAPSACRPTTGRPRSG